MRQALTRGGDRGIAEISRQAYRRALAGGDAWVVLPAHQYRSHVTHPLYQDPWAVASNRTGARMKIDFRPNYVIEEKNVGPSRLYNSAGTLKEQRTASTKGIVFSERAVSSSLYQVKLSHEVGIGE